jgi:hypothetical protein
LGHFCFRATYQKRRKALKGQNPSIGVKFPAAEQRVMPLDILLYKNRMFVRSLFMETCEIKILQMRRSLGIKEIYAYIKTAESYITQMLKQYLNLKAGLKKWFTFNRPAGKES